MHLSFSVPTDTANPKGIWRYLLPGFLPNARDPGHDQPPCRSPPGLRPEEAGHRTPPSQLGAELDASVPPPRALVSVCHPRECSYSPISLLNGHVVHLNSAVHRTAWVSFSLSQEYFLLLIKYCPFLAQLYWLNPSHWCFYFPPVVITVNIF